MLYLKRKSDGKEYPVWKYINNSETEVEVTVWVYSVGKFMIPSDEYELIFKP